jgi:acetaldehyde dehydrogenase (acetylating)
MVPYPATGKANLKTVPNTSDISVKPNSASAYSQTAKRTIIPEAKIKIVNVGSSPIGNKLFIVNGGRNEYTGSRGVFFWTCVAGRLIKSLKEITSIFFALSK